MNILVCGVTIFAATALGGQPENFVGPIQVVESEAQTLDQSIFSRLRVMTDDASRLLGLYERKGQAPSTTTVWQPLTSSKAEVQSQIDRLAESVEKLLLPDEYTSFIATARRGNDEISRLRLEISEYKTKQLEAPDERYLLDPVTVTKSAIDTYIKNRADKIQKITLDLADKREQFSSFLFENYGVMLSEDQIDALLYRFDGEDSLKSLVVVGVVGELLKGIEQVIEVSGESNEIAIRYYSVNVLVREVVYNLWGRHYNRYDSEWFPELAKKELEIKDLLKQNRRYLTEERDDTRRSSDIRRIGYRKNIAANKFTLNVIVDYRSRLLEQQHQVRRQIGEAKKELQYARVTLGTATTSGDILAQIRASQEEFQALLAIQLPDLRPFENEELKAEFRKLSKEMR